MGLLSWTEKSPTTLANGGVIGPDERLPWPQTTVMGVQHLIAMFGATVLARASTVAPNMAIRCCTPMTVVCGQGRRSSGPMTPPLARVVGDFSVQLNRPMTSPSR